MLFIVLFMLDIVLYRHGKYSGNTGNDGSAVPGVFVLCVGQKKWDFADSNRWIYGMSCDIWRGEFYNMRESWTEMRIKSRKATLTIAVLNILAFITNLVLGGGSFFGLFISGGETLLGDLCCRRLLSGNRNHCGTCNRICNRNTGGSAYAKEEFEGMTI